MKIINYSTKIAIIPNVHQLVNLPCYHHDLDKQSAHTLLYQSPHKHFLLRKGEEQAAVTISYKWCQEVCHKPFLYVLGKAKTSTHFCLSLTWHDLFSDHHKPNCVHHPDMVCWYSGDHWQQVVRQQPNALKFLAAAQIASMTRGNPKFLHHLILPTTCVSYILDNFGVPLYNSYSFNNSPLDYFLVCHELIPALE